MLPALLPGCLAGCLAGPAAAQDWDCSDFAALPQQGLNYCVQEDYQRWDAALNTAYGAAMAQVEGTREEEVLRAAQRAWITYRDNACDVEALVMRGGTAEPLIYFGCMSRLTQRRAEDLSNFAGQF